MSDVRSVVIDNGSSMTKTGFSGDDSPQSIFPTIVSRRFDKDISHNDSYIKDEAQSANEIRAMGDPIQRGIIQNWEDMQNIWYHTFYNELRIVPEEHPVLLAEIPFNPKVNSEKMTEIMFETFNIPAMSLCIQSVLSLYASGHTTGVVFDSGDGASYAVPIYDGNAIHYAITRFDLAGCDLTDYMSKILTERGYSFTTSAEREVVRDIKEKLSYVALDYDKELALAASSQEVDRQYELPDGQVITVGNERFRCPEVLFEPSYIGLGQPSIAHVIHNSIKKCDGDSQKHIFRNIVLSGGNTIFNGIDERLTKGISQLVSTWTNFKVISTRQRFHSAWVGGSLLASHSSFTNQWITYDKYNEYGPTIVHRKRYL